MEPSPHISERHGGGTFLDIRGPGYVGLFSHFPADLQVHSHDSLLPHNILLDGFMITATPIGQWETTGYYPEFPDSRRREKEIDAVSKSFFISSTALWMYDGACDSGSPPTCSPRLQHTCRETVLLATQCIYREKYRFRMTRCSQGTYI